MKKIVIIAVIVIALLGLSAGAYFLFFKKAEDKTEDKSKPLAAPVPVKVTTAARGRWPTPIS